MQLNIKYVHPSTVAGLVLLLFSIFSSHLMRSLVHQKYAQKRKKAQTCSPVIILTFTPKFRALLIVSALSCLGGSNRGRSPINFHGPPGLSFLPSGTSYSTKKPHESEHRDTPSFCINNVHEINKGIITSPGMPQQVIVAHALRICQ